MAKKKSKIKIVIFKKSNAKAANEKYLYEEERSVCTSSNAVIETTGLLCNTVIL